MLGKRKFVALAGRVLPTATGRLPFGRVCDKNVKAYYPSPFNSPPLLFLSKKVRGTKRGGFENHGYPPS